MKKWVVIVIITIAGLLIMTDTVILLAARREDEFNDLIDGASSISGVPKPLIKAIIRTESDFNPDAVNPSDPSAGLMQTTPATATVMLGYHVTVEDLKDPRTSIVAGTKYLAYLLARYQLDDAVQMYNLGEGKFRKGLRAPDYLAKVKRFYAYYGGQG